MRPSGMPNANVLDCRMGRPRIFPLPNIGQRFGRLAVIADPVRGHRGATSIPCRCDCGQERVIDFTALRTGQTQSCGCLKSERFGHGRTTHGGASDRLYGIWIGMRERCSYEKHVVFRYYGGRGIRVCDAWRQSYEEFRAWALANGYDDHLEIDRIDADGNYAPENCRWVTAAFNRQQANRRRWART